MNGEPVQMPGEGEIAIPLDKLDHEPDTSFFQDMVRPFNLQNECLSRFHLFTFENRTYFFIDIHHSIYDGLSMTVLTQDILDAYNGCSLSEETVTAYDAALFEEERLSTDASVRAEEFFRMLLLETESAVFPGSAVPSPFATASS